MVPARGRGRCRPPPGRAGPPEGAARQHARPGPAGGGHAGGEPALPGRLVRALRDAGGTLAWYILFNADNSWLISDTADGSAQRVYGTYVVEGNVASGPMVNPGTGEGEIVATLSGATLNLDFVEFWHSPPKHVPYTGTKL